MGVNFIGALTPVENLRLQLVANYLDGEYTDFNACFPFTNVVTGKCEPIEGKQLQRQPKLRFMFTPSYRFVFGWGDIMPYVTYTHVGDHTQDQSGLQELGSYQTWDFGVTSNVGENWQFNLRGTNVTNELGLTESNSRIFGVAVAAGRRVAGASAGRPRDQRAGEVQLVTVRAASHTPRRIGALLPEAVDSHTMLLLASAAVAQRRRTAPLQFRVTEGRVTQCLPPARPRRGASAAQLGPQPRVLVAFPAGNSGVGVWFERHDTGAMDARRNEGHPPARCARPTPAWHRGATHASMELSWSATRCWAACACCAITSSASHIRPRSEPRPRSRRKTMTGPGRVSTAPPDTRSRSLSKRRSARRKRRAIGAGADS